MLKAYDNILQSEVTADLAAMNSSFEPYRYECSCCGEEVYIAASYSKKMVAHFRHKSGNNHVECDKYIGKYGAINTSAYSRKSKRERIDFYFDNTNKTFNISLRFSEKEIVEYEKTKTAIEVRVNSNDKPFIVLDINRLNYIPDYPNMVPLHAFSLSYYVANSQSRETRKFYFFKDLNRPTIFKILGDEYNFKAKLIHGDTVFTNVRYLLVSEDNHLVSREGNFPIGIQIEESFHFETMNRKFLGFVFQINSKTPKVVSWLNNRGYRLEVSEILTMLWPPSSLINDIWAVLSNEVFILSTFKLQAYGNINLHSDEFESNPYGVSKVFLNQNVKIHKKNVEILIEKAESLKNKPKSIEVDIRYEKDFTVSDDGKYFIFNDSGVTPLNKGQVVFLTPNSRIVKYEFNQPVICIYPYKHNEMSGKELLNDVLKHYKREEPFDPEEFKKLFQSDVATRYIEKCYKTGYTNPVVKQYIKEGCI